MLLNFFLNKFSFLSIILKLEFKIFLDKIYSPCSKTRRFLNLCIFEFLYFNTRRFKNLCVLNHGGFVRQNCSYFPISVFQYTEIQKQNSCIKRRNFLISMFQYTEIQKYPCIETRRFKNFHVLYTQIFFQRPITQ